MKRLAAILLLIGLALLLWGYRNATADPVVRRATVRLDGWPEGAAPIRVLLLTDIHVAGPDMPPSRLARIVRRANALRPDLVLIAGDLISDKRLATRTYPADAAVAPLGRLRAPLGTVAVLGNHDHWRDADAFRRALTANGITVLANSAVRKGPVTIMGIDDAFSGHADIAAATEVAAALGGPVVALSHTPDVAPALPPWVPLVLAGHTHCGQIVLPLLGRLASMSHYGQRYACGLVREPGRIVVIGAGLGTSLVPLRYGAPPDLWLLTLGPAQGATRR